MQKVYLLLRNNRQTGPHTLDELIELTLKPTDLIWVEGKSAGWSHPSEIDTLNSFLEPSAIPEPIVPMQPGPRSASTPPVNPTKVFVSLPFGKTTQSVPASSDPIEEKAAALRQRILSGETAPAQQEVQTKYARTLEEVEDNYTSWMYQKKTARKKPIKKGAAILIGVVASAGVAIAWWLSQPGGNDVAKTITASPLIQTPASQAPSSAPPSTPASETQDDITMPVVNRVTVEPSAPAPGIKPKEEKKTVGTGKGKRQEPPVPSANIPGTAEPERETAGTGTVSNEPSTGEGAAEKPEEKKKKKTLKEFLGGIFRKKEKEEVPSTAPAPNGERPASRRESSETESLAVDLSDKVVLKLEKPSTEWMMGVEGQKLTLANRSTHALQAATVEVSYYSEQNSLLQKKTLQYGPLAAGKSQTLAVPNHRLADHVSYEVREAVGK